MPFRKRFEKDIVDEIGKRLMFVRGDARLHGQGHFFSKDCPWPYNLSRGNATSLGGTIMEAGRELRRS